MVGGTACSRPPTMIDMVSLALALDLFWAPFKFPQKLTGEVLATDPVTQFPWDEIPSQNIG